MTQTLPRLRPTDDEIAAPPPRLWLEVGFGGGEHALAQIAAHPDVTLFACEVFENGISSLLSRLVPEADEATAPLPPNLRVWNSDARTLIARLPDASVERFFLLYPDPWPKARHAKRRFVHPDSIAAIARILQPGGEWRIASDDPTYQAWVEHVLAAQPYFDAAPPALVRPDDWPATRYGLKAQRAGRTSRFWTVMKRQAVNIA